MMGRLNQDQGQFFYSFCLDDAVPGDHRVREIAAVLDLSWVHAELASLLCDLPSLNRSGIDASDARPRLRVRDPLGASDLP